MSRSLALPDPVLAKIIWICGPPDSGKTTAAKALARRYGTLRYEYDRADVRHHKRLAEYDITYREFLDASLDERWLDPTPEALAERALASFTDRFPLVLDDLATLEAIPLSLVLAEGFGLTPALVAPLLQEPHQAVCLVPTEAFREQSWAARGKPSFAAKTSNPERVAANLFERDRLLTDALRQDAAAHHLRTIEVDEFLHGEEFVDLVAAHFAPVVARVSAGS